MTKKTISILAFLLLVCQQVSFAQTSVKKVAIITFFTSKEINSSEVAGISTMIAKVSKDPAMKLDSAMATFYSAWKTDFAGAFPFAFISEDSVLNNPAYPTIMDNSTQYYSPNMVLTPEGKNYIPINGIAPFRNSDAIKKSFEIIKNADAVMVVFLSFSIQKVGMEIAGFGKAKVKAYANIQLLGKDAKPLMKLKEGALSTSGFEYALGGAILDVSTIQPLCIEATNNLVLDLKKSLPSKLAKYLKKIGGK